MSNSVNLALDVTKTDIQNTSIKIRQGDGGFETLHTTVTSNGNPMDLQGWTITFMGTTAGNHKIIDTNVKIVEAPNGIFEYTPSKAWGMDIGYFKIAYFKFVKGDGSTSSANFRVNVIEAIDLTQDEAQNYISVIDATIAETREHLESSLADVSSSVAATSTAASSMDINVSSIASSAVSEVNSAASNASLVAASAVDNINGAANQVTSKFNSITNNGGGRNLLLGTRNLEQWSWISKVPVTNGQEQLQAITGTADPSQDYFDIISFGDIPLEKNTDYTASFWIKTSENTDIWSYFYDSGSNGVYSDSATVNQSTTDYTRIVVHLHNGDNSTRLNFKPARINKKSAITVWIYGFMLEKGIIAHDWQPAPQDAPSNDAQLVHKTGNETLAGDKTLVGNTTLATTTILAGNYGLRVTTSGIQKTTDGKTWVDANI